MPGCKAAANRGIEYLNYIERNWLDPPLWNSWSVSARQDAADKLSISLGRTVALGEILTTTNYAESFNRVFKHLHVEKHKRGGRRIRVDVLLIALVTNTIPSIFRKRRADARFIAWSNARFNLDDVPTLHSSTTAPDPPRSMPPLAWMEPDAKRDAEAAYIYAQRRIDLVRSQDMTSLSGTCLSSHSFRTDFVLKHYNICIYSTQWATCDCPDFLKNGGACKHLCAAYLLAKEHHVGNFGGLVVPMFRPLLASKAEAERLYLRRQSASKRNEGSLPSPALPSEDSIAPALPEFDIQSSYHAEVDEDGVDVEDEDGEVSDGDRRGEGEGTLSQPSPDAEMRVRTSPSVETPRDTSQVSIDRVFVNLNQFN